MPDIKQYKKIIDKYKLNYRNMANDLGISQGYLHDLINGRQDEKKGKNLVKLRTYLRNMSTDILNFLEKNS